MRIIEIASTYIEAKNRERTIAEVEETLKQTNFSPDYQRISESIVKKLEESAEGFKYGINNDDRNFEIGDKVTGIGIYEGAEIDGLSGKIVYLGNHSAGVEWEKNIGGHDCGGKAKYGYGWDVTISHIRKGAQIKAGTKQEYLRFIEKLTDDISRYKEEPHVGDKVEIIEGATYSTTVPGSWGYVEEVREDNLGIEFHYIPDHARLPDFFPIRKKDVKVIASEEEKADLQKILNKAKSEAKQEIKEQETKCKQAIKESAEKLKSIGMDEREIFEFMLKRNVLDLEGK